MKFYVIWIDGRRFGPADVPTLSEWAKQGRVKPDTDLENADTGERVKARDVQGIQFASPTAPGDDLGQDPALKPEDLTDKPQQTVAPGTPYQAAGPQATGGPQSAGGGFQNPPQPGSPYPRSEYAAEAGEGKTELVWSFVCSIGGFFACCCFPISAVGLYLGSRAKSKGHPSGQAAVVVGWISLSLAVIYWAYTLISGAAMMGPDLFNR
ncbi:MAG: DUF4190 domain-containing protein [Armatimonadetes bacterium]|nr:DUF4190 domain-containing protein [Armatimonadota bacterium]